MECLFIPTPPVHFGVNGAEAAIVEHFSKWESMRVDVTYPDLAPALLELGERDVEQFHD